MSDSLRSDKICLEHKISWGINGFGERFYDCTKCGKVFGYLSYDEYLKLIGFEVSTELTRE